MKPYTLSDKVWKKAIVTTRLDYRSYEICSEDENIYRRNRAHLKESNEFILFEDNTRQLEEKKSDSTKTLCQEIVKDKPRRIKYLNHKV